MTSQVKGAVVETSIEFTFSNGDAISLTKSQISELVSGWISETCRNCPHLVEKQPIPPKPSRRKKPVLDP